MFRTIAFAMALVGPLWLNQAFAQKTDPAEPDDAADTKTTVEDAEKKIRDLAAEFSKEQGEFVQKLRKAKTREERTELFRNGRPSPEKYTSKFMAIADNHPKTPVALKALTWLAQNVRSRKAIKRIQEDHLQDEGIGPLLGLLAHSASDSEGFLRKVVKENPHPGVRGMACFSLARSMIPRGGSLAADKEAEVIALLERTIKDCADIKTPRGTSYGKLAERTLFEIRYLQVGKTAPEIEGEDIDGVPFKLSDYRGKVVLLDFWGDW